MDHNQAETMFSALPSGYYSITPFYRGKRETEIQAERHIERGRQTNRYITLRNRGIDIQIYRKIERQMHEQTNRWIKKKRDRQTDREN